jgi:hypothetical protein
MGAVDVFKMADEYPLRGQPPTSTDDENINNVHNAVVSE